MIHTFSNQISTPPTDEVLVKLAIAGDHSAFEMIVKRYQTSIYNYLYRLLNQDALQAEEAAQDTFVHAYQSLNKFNSHKPLRPWLFGIATNQARVAWRCQTRKQTYEVNPDSEDETFNNLDLPDPTTRQPDALLISKDLLRQINTALAAMDTRYRSVLLLRFQEDLSYQDIANTLQIQLNTVRTWLRRGKISLQKALQSEVQRYDSG